MMAKILDPDDYDADKIDIDNQVFCANPRCGSPNVKILSYPVPGSWFGTFGRAQCGDCGAVFSIQLDEEGDADQA